MNRSSGLVFIRVSWHEGLLLWVPVPVPVLLLLLVDDFPKLNPYS